MAQQKEPTFQELEKQRQDAENALMNSLTPEQGAALAKVRAVEAKRLAQDKAATDEALAQRVAEILAGKMSGPRVHGTQLGEPARVVGHQTLVCRNCGHTRSADDQSESKTPSAGGCRGYMGLTHDFHGADTVVTSIPKLEAHHAVYIDGTVTHPAVV